MLRDLLLPATDGGVYAQAIGLAAVTLLALMFARRNRDLVVFIVGAAVFVAALMALRTLH